MSENTRRRNIRVENSNIDEFSTLCMGGCLVWHWRMCSVPLLIRIWASYPLLPLCFALSPGVEVEADVANIIKLAN